MFNIMILDVAIGMIFIYLLLSLMCTAANEIIELLLKKRAIDLERGIRELLVPGTDSGTSDIVEKLYDHPLINGLFGGKYQDSRIATKLRWVARTKLPSYIPARNFSLAFMDLILPGVGPKGEAIGQSGATNATAASPAPISPPPVVVNVSEGAAPIVVPPVPADVVTKPSLTGLRDALLDNEDIPARVKQAIVPLIDAAGNDVAKARENIEGWFNSSMDRVSSWYKRRAQVTILILGLFIAIAVNVDTITVARRLSTDKALRESLVSAAQEYAKAHAEPSPANFPDNAPDNAPVNPANSAAGSTPTPTQTPTPSPTPPPCPTPTPRPSPAPAPPDECKVDPKSAECKYAKILLTTECAKGKDSEECKTITELLEDCVTDPESEACKYSIVLTTIPECRDDKTSSECKQKALLATIPACSRCREDSPKCKYEVNKRQLESLGLPIGWTSVEDPKHKWPGSRFRGEGGWAEQIQWHWLGWLLTALALSLGAPFWFDLLNKFIVIRSAVKPHEKSLEEKSKG